MYVYLWVQVHVLENRSSTGDEDAKSNSLVLSGVSCLVFSGSFTSVHYARLTIV
jgi:hypothetical protein